MKTSPTPSPLSLSCGVKKSISLLGIGLLPCVLSTFLGAQSIQNGSFEVDTTFPTFPGYLSGAGNSTSITGWTHSNASRIGINSYLNAEAQRPFANNGRPADGNQVAFIQNSGGPSSLSQTITDLVVGETYKISYHYNARSGQNPTVNATIGSTVLQDSVIFNVGSNRPMYYGGYEFVATAPTQILTFTNASPSGDTTFTLDAVKIEKASEAKGWTINSWSNDATSGVQSSKSYTHAINFQGQAATSINGVNFVNTTTGNPVGSNFRLTGFATPYTSVDPNAISGGADGSAEMAKHFIYNGTNQVINLTGLLPGQQYETTLYTVGWEAPNTSAQRGVVASVNGHESVSLMQSHYGDNQGARFTYKGTADASGNISISLAPFNGASTFHLYGLTNNAAPDLNHFYKPIIGTSFGGNNNTQYHGQNIVNTAPDYTNQPGHAWVETGMNANGQTTINGSRAQVSANSGAAIDIRSNGTYEKPQKLRLQADLSVNTLFGSTTDAASRGVNLGFYSSDLNPDINRESGIGFTGLGLAPDGSLRLIQNGGASTLMGIAGSVAYGGTFDPTKTYRLTYEVDTLSGAISSIFLEGSTADYSTLVSSAFTEENTAYLGFFGSGNAWGQFGYVDNLMLMEVVPEPSRALLLTSFLAMLGMRRRR